LTPNETKRLITQWRHNELWCDWLGDW